jgi:pimeloyl-ACP methyl ester carboxylesterase
MHSDDCMGATPRRTSTSTKTSRAAVTAGVLTLASMAGSAAPAMAAPVKNIVLVHGAWVDGSGWKPVYEMMSRRGYNVSIVQEPLTSFENDVAAVKRAIALEQGPVILVGHSYAGSVITEAGNDPRVVGLVYIAAHEPDAGETEGANGKRMPNASKPPLETPDGFTYLDPALFPEEFAPDLPHERAVFEAHSQIPTAAAVFNTPVTAPAWRVKPSWTLVAGSDKIINPDLERMYAARAHARSVKVVPGASHSVYESHPGDVTALIEQAAEQSESR